MKPHHLLLQRDELLLAWAAKRIPYVGRDGFGEARAIGIMNGPDTATARLLGVAVFHMYVPEYRTCQVSFASASPLWAHPVTIRDIFSFPFFQYKCNRVWTAVPHTSPKTMDIQKKLGFTQEGVLRHHFGPGTHAAVYGLLYKEFLKRYPVDGKKEPLSAPAA